MAQAINGVQQASTDRATRIAQILEQRHLQTEMAAAAYAREDGKRAAEVAKPGESFQAKPGDRESTDGRRHDDASRKKRPDDEPVPTPEATSGRIVDLTA